MALPLPELSHSHKAGQQSSQLLQLLQLLPQTSAGSWNYESALQQKVYASWSKVQRGLWKAAPDTFRSPLDMLSDGHTHRQTHEHACTHVHTHTHTRWCQIRR